MLGPIFFFVYINDLPKDIVSQMRFFADDSAIYLTVEDKGDSDTLQRDLDRLQTWEARWDMEFNPSKCQIIIVTSRVPPTPPSLQTQYILHRQVLEVVSTARYLGWISPVTHVHRITTNASTSLRFVKRNVKQVAQRATIAHLSPMCQGQISFKKIRTHPSFNACSCYMKVSKRSNQKQQRKSGNTIFPIISLWGYFLDAQGQLTP